jgi:uncharacterized protein (DUF1778 family)
MPAAKRKKESPVEAKARMNFRLPLELKARVAQAAAVRGQELTDFATSALSEKADQVLEEHFSLPLGQEEYAFFLSVLSDDTEPTDYERAAAERYRSGHREGVRYYFADRADRQTS